MERRFWFDTVTEPRRETWYLDSRGQTEGLTTFPVSLGACIYMIYDIGFF